MAIFHQPFGRWIPPFRREKVNGNETLSPRIRLSNGREGRAAGEVVDARHRGFSFLCGGELHRAAFGMLFESGRQSDKQGIAAKDAQHASS
jgi:hypothetical protein